MFQWIDRLYKLFYGLVHLFWETPRGVDFLRPAYPNYRAMDFVHYQTATMRLTKEMLRDYVVPGAQVLDVGCGKGYFIYCAKKLGFQYVDGIEYDPVLAQTAKNNFRALGMEGVQVANMDAVDFMYLEGYTVFYLFNPFTGSTMKTFLENLEQSIRLNPRTVLVIYHNPVEHRLWDASELFELEETRFLRWMYRQVPVAYYLHRNW